MSERTEKIFADGLYVQKPSEKAPSFIIANLSINVDEFKAFLDAHSKDGEIRLNVKESQKGGYYAELDTYVSKSSTPRPPREAKEKKETLSIEYPEDDINPDDIPF